MGELQEGQGQGQDQGQGQGQAQAQGQGQCQGHGHGHSYDLRHGQGYDLRHGHGQGHHQGHSHRNVKVSLFIRRALIGLVRGAISDGNTECPGLVGVSIHLGLMLP